MKLLAWITRNPLTIGGILLALGAQAAEHPDLSIAATVCVFLGRAIVTAAEIVAERRDK